MDDRATQQVIIDHPHIIGSDAYSSFLTRRFPPIKRSDSMCSSTLDSISETTLDEEFLSESRSKRQTIGRSMATSIANVLDKPGCVLSSAMSYLRNRSRMETEHLPSMIEGNCVSADRFETSLNRCDPSSLGDLRRKRAEDDPIICHENDDDEDENADIALFLETMIACGGQLHVIKPQLQALKTYENGRKDKDATNVKEIMLGHHFEGIAKTKNQRSEDEHASFHHLENPNNTVIIAASA
jgi:hypothetical protein